jgi:LysR family transcriptional regulator, carnitine catabolism transcriptional activator
MTGSYHWSDLQVRHLRALLAVTEHGSFAAAGLALGYTQSGISQQIQVLERIVGVQLLRRFRGGRRPVEPTEAGAVLVAHGRRLLAELETARAAVVSASPPEDGPVRVATVQSIAARLLPGAIAQLRAGRPSVAVEVRIGGLPELADAIEQGHADIAFTALPVPGDRFVVRELGADPYVLVCAQRDPVTQVRDLTGRRILGIPLNAHEVLVARHLAADGVVPAAHERYEDNGLIQELVAGGQGVAIVPSLTVYDIDPRVRVVPLPSLPPRRLAAVTLRGRCLSPPALDLIDLVAGGTPAHTADPRGMPVL